MRRLCDRRAAAVLVAALPSFLSTYDEIVARQGADLTCADVFGEIADLARELLGTQRDDRQERALEEIFLAIERVAETPGVDVARVVGECFLSELDPFQRSADPYFGPHTAQIAGELDDRNAIDDADVDSGEVSRATPPRLRARPRRYSGRAPRRRLRP